MSSQYTYWHWQNMFSHNELLQLHEVFNTHYDKTVEDKPALSAIKTSKLKMVPWRLLKDKLWNMEQIFLSLNSTDIGYNVWPQYDYQMATMNEYTAKNKSEYGWHKDDSNSFISDIKFTMLINASLEPYEGGEFNMFSSQGGLHVKELDNPGDCIVFISHNYHKVTPVTKGKRHSISLFYSGPRFI